MPNANCVIHGYLTDEKGNPIQSAEIRLHQVVDEREIPETIKWTTTNDKGQFTFTEVRSGAHSVSYTAFVEPKEGMRVHIPEDCQSPETVIIKAPLQIEVNPHVLEGDRTNKVTHLQTGQTAILRCESAIKAGRIRSIEYLSAGGRISIIPLQESESQVRVQSGGRHYITALFTDNNPGSNSGTAAIINVPTHFDAIEQPVTQIGGGVDVRLSRALVEHTQDQALWASIRLHTRRIAFGPYQEFINRVLCGEERESLGDSYMQERFRDVSRHGVAAYDLLRYATEVFLLRNCGVKLEVTKTDRRFFHREAESARLQEPVTFEFVQQKLREYLGSPPQLPYITRIISDAFPWQENRERDDSVLTCRRLNQPCLIELIWSYWHEEGMLMQTMNAVTRRFQNLRSHHRDPLANLEIDPLRPLNNVLWGFIQDEFRRLTVKRRGYEYSHQYGLALYGKALSNFRPADNRSKFLEAFHNLLHLTSVFFKEDNDTTVIADGYPLLNSLKEVHLLLAQGAQNQFGDLPWTARSEMLLQQWMLARPEMRDFLQSRAMVPYKEPWMPQVDAMKAVQGWSDVTVTHFRDLGVYGEQILLSVRYGDWVGINDEDSAKNWARYWRPEIQGYLHAYRAATGVDLSHGEAADSTMPSLLLQGRLELQQQRLR